MSTRADRRDIGETSVWQPSMLGGLDTKSPAHRVDPASSPDLLNVSFDRLSVARRGGFAPLLREIPGAGSIRNSGRRVESRARAVAAPGQTTYAVVAGCGHAGHRPAWDDSDVRDGLCVDLFVQIDDLLTSHGGNAGAAGAGPPYGPSPYDLKVRPILSKGPVKRHIVEALHMAGTDGWQTTSRWGPLGAGSAAMPMCLYLFYTGVVWEIRFSFHSWDGAAWQLNTIGTDLASIGGVKTGQLYHVVAGYSLGAGQAVMRIGHGFGETPGYVTVTNAVTGTPMSAMTPTPVQLFDCPQEFIEAPGGASATRPPGLALNSAASGGYWFASKRFEGVVEDIAIWRGLPANVSTGALDRRARLTPGQYARAILQHWPCDGPEDGFLREVSGVGNSIMLVPSDPAWEKSGGLDGGALRFDGTVGYALCEQSDVQYSAGKWEDGRGGRTSWRTRYAAPGAYLRGQWEACVKQGLPHGLEAVVWPDAIEPNNEQVVIEAHGVARIVISHDGFIKAYVRDNAAVPAYQAAGISAQRVVPGTRYHIALIRYSGTLAQLWVNGTMEQQTNPVAQIEVSSPVGGLTIGAGSQATLGAAGDAGAASLPADVVSIDHRTHLCGRVERVAVLCGSLPLDTTVGSSRVITQDGVTRSGYTIPFGAQLLVSNLAVPPTIRTLDGTREPVPDFGAGHGLDLPQLQQGAPASTLGGRTLTPIISTAGPTPWEFGVGELPHAGFGGMELAYSQTGIVWRAIAAYQFDRKAPEFGYLGHYSWRVESTSAASPSPHRVHIHRGYVRCSFGRGGDVQLRCVWSDVMAETNSLGILVDRPSFGPYESASPRELAPQYWRGILTPPVDENPIAMIADWRHETTGEQFQIIGCRRQLFWAKPRWRQDSPFGSGKSLWFWGDKVEYARATVAKPQGSLATEVDVIDCWIKPTKLRGDRVLMVRGDPAASTMRWGVVIRDGQILVAGQLVNGNTWAWHSGQEAGSPTRNLAVVPIVANRWQHLAIRIGSGAVEAWVDGQVVTMTAAPITYALLGTIGQADAPACQDLWVGGLGSERPSLLVGTRVIQLSAWSGLVRHVRESSDLTDLGFQSLRSGTRPAIRPASSGATRQLYQLDSTAATEWHDGLLDLRVRELVAISCSLSDMERVPASHAAFRNRLVIAHPSGPPRAVKFMGFDQDEPFAVERLGIQAPYQQTYAYQIPLVDWTGAGNNFSLNDRVQVYCSYLNQETGEESAVGEVADTVRTGGDVANLVVNNFPRSPDPQVTARRVYLGIGGSLPVYVGTIHDNSSLSFEIQTSVGFGGTVPDPLARLAAEPSRIVMVSNGALLLANTEQNPNLFQLSGESMGYFPLANQVAIDSRDGRGIVGAAEHLNSTFLFKRNGTWAVVSGGVRTLNIGAGCGGGAQTYDNLVFGCGDRGVWTFDGSNFAYVSEALEREFEQIDTTEPGLLAQQGVYHYPRSQYWLSVRGVGDTMNDTAYVLHTAAGGGAPWARMGLPRHVAMSSITLDGRPALAIGDSCGRVLVLTERALDDMPAGYDATVSGTATGREIAMSPGTLPGNLRGATVLVAVSGDVGAAGQEARVVWSNDRIMVVDRDIPQDVLLVGIGGFDAYWSSSWLGPQQQGSHLKVEALDLMFDPNAAILTLEHASAQNHAQLATTFPTNREFGSDLSPVSQSLDMASGWLEQPAAIRDRQMGRYWRFRVGTYGAPGVSPGHFAITSWALRWAGVGTRGAPT